MKSLFFLLSFLSYLPAHALNDNFFRSLRSENLFVYDYQDGLALNTPTQDLPEWLVSLRKNYLKWTPNLTSRTSEGCNPKRELNIDPTPKAAAEFFKKCEIENRIGDIHTMAHLTKMLTIDYPLVTSPQGRTVQFHLKGGIKVRGQLLLKGNIKRPIVVVRTGVFSSLASAIPERFIPMALFDEGPFHLLILPSLTGSDFINDNSEYSYGGFEEGIQTLEVIRILKNPEQPISKLISDVSTVGISMGGHGVLWANLLASQQEIPLIKNSLLFCPLIDLHKTEEHALKHPLWASILATWATKRMKSLDEKFGSIKSSMQPPTTIAGKMFSIGRLISYFENKYSEPLTGWPQELPQEILSEDRSFYGLNNYLKWWKSDLKIPTVAFYSKVDPLVPPRLNIELHKNDPALRNGTFASVEMPTGIHCSMPTAYNWNFLSSFLREFLGEKSIPQEAVWSQAFSGDFAKLLSKSTLKVENVEILLESNLVKVMISLNEDSYVCKNIFTNIKNLCRKDSFEIHIPLSALDLDITENNSNQNATLIRWLSVNLQIREQPDGFWIVLFRPERSLDKSLSQL